MSPFPIHFAIDLEPDERLPDAANKSCDSAGIALSRMSALRKRLEDATGMSAQFGWYVRMDRHIAGLYGDPSAIALRYKDQLDAASEAGDVVGLHIHCFEPLGDGRWRANYADQQLVTEIVDEGFDNFERVFQSPCEVARMGDMWTNENCMRQFAARGVRFDVSLESGLRPKHMSAHYPGTDSKGCRPSMLGAPFAPFQPFGSDENSMWALPLASSPRRDYLNPRMWLVSAYSSVTTGLRRSRARMMLRPQQTYAPGALRAAIDAALQEGKQPGFCVPIRNFGAAGAIEKFLDVLCDVARERPIKFCTPADYVRLTQKL